MSDLPDDHPVRRLGLDLSEPPEASDHGLPLGNGLLGCAIWGDGAPLKLSLDRGDLWDLREVPEFQAADYTWDAVAEAHAAGHHDELIAQLEQPYRRAGPTKLPAGRITLTASAAARRFRLDRAAMTAEVTFADGARLEAFVEARGDFGRLRGAGLAPGFAAVAPPFDAEPPGWKRPEGFTGSFNDVWELGYPAARPLAGSDAAGFVQEGWNGFAFALALAWAPSAGGGWEAAWTIETRQGDEPLGGLATRTLARTRDALRTPFAETRARHAAWWAGRWRRARVDLPDPEIERLYYAGLGFLDSAARPGAPPVPLQGPWTSDTGRLPPWKGDYHHDLNTEMTYWPAYASDRLDAARGFADWLWDTREACLEWTRRFYGVEGLNAPMTADLLNRQMGGWRQYTHSVASGAWLAQHVYWSWRFAGDTAFLRERAYPWLTDAARFIDAITAAPDGGPRRARLSSSPEIHDNRPRAWFPETLTNYELALFRAALGWAAEAAEAMARASEAARWRRVASELPALALDEDGGLLIAPGEALTVSHRHHSHAMAIYPLGLIRPLENPDDARVAGATLERLRRLGTSAWMGYSFAWRASLSARAGQGDAAADDLLAFARGFTYPNGFHSNGDWRGRGYSDAVFGAFTLEGNSAAANAVCEMLLQADGGRVRLFPAAPSAWPHARFEGLRTVQNIVVSAAWSAGRLDSATLSGATPQTVDVALGRGPARVRLALDAGVERRLSARELDRLNDGAA